MLSLRPAAERGHFENDWLNSWHSFSFGEYYDPQHMGVSVLRVINEDRVVPGAGFSKHPHNNMEIVSYVLQGELAHQDSLGNGSVIQPGDVQRMSAGTGVTHSEYNPSEVHSAHFLQIWLLPNQQGIKPSYEQKYFPPDDKRDRLVLLVSPDGQDGSIQAFSDALMYASLLAPDVVVSHRLASDRMAYLHIATGDAEVNGQRLQAGAGATLIDEARVDLKGIKTADILLFDLPRH